MAAIPLILCPGLLNDGALWAHPVEQLTLAGLARPSVADLGGAESISELATTILATAPERFALAGLSMGGYVAFEIMRRAPERVARLALLNTSARPDSREASERRLTMIDIARKGGFDRLPGQIMATQLHPAALADPAITGAIEAMARRIGAEGFIRQQRAILSRPDSRPDLRRIACPTVVIGGRQDGLTTPEILGEIAAGIPAAKLVLIDHCGHLSPLEQPEAVSAVLACWLQG
jgi:pimeloyl-ACP methyl ester carboxylesterase